MIASVLFLQTILFSKGLPHHGDLAYPYYADLYAERFFPLWNEHTSVTNLENLDRMFLFPLVLLARIWGGTEVLAKLFFLIPLCLSGWCVIPLVKRILVDAFPQRVPNTLVIFVASLVYMVNPWVLEQVQAPFFWLAYAVTPAIILLTYKCFRKGKVLCGIGSSILWTMASGSPHYAIFTGLVMLLVWMFTIFLDLPRDVPALGTRLKRDLKLGFFIIGLYGLFNAFWIIPIGILYLRVPVSPGYAFDAGMLDMFSRNSYFLNVISGMDQWITWYPKAPAVNFLASLTKVSLPIILIAAFLRKKKNQQLFIVLLAVWIVGTVFSLGAKNPLYIWLAIEAPLANYYGWLLRVPGKISYLLWPAYAASIGILLNHFYYKILNSNVTTFHQSSWGHILLKKGVATMIIVGIMIAPMGFATVKGLDYFNYYYAPVPVPEPYRQAFNYMDELQENPRVADLAPYDQGLGKNSLGFESSFTWNPDRIAGYFIPGSISVPSIGFYHFTYSSTWRPAYDKFSNPITSSTMSWLAAYGVSHILYHDDIVGTQEIAQRDLQNLNDAGFELVEQWDYVYLYKVSEHLGRIYTLSPDFLGELRLGRSLFFDSFEDQDGPFSDVLSGLDDPDQIRVLEEDYNGINHFLQVTPDSSGWTTLRSNVFFPETDSVFVSTAISQTNANQTHVVIRGFDIKKGDWVQIAQVPSGQDGTFSWKTYNASVKIPVNIEGIQVELNAGWVASGLSQSEVCFDNILITEILGPPTVIDIEASGVRLEEIKQIGVTRWELKLIAEKPFQLVFTEGYDPYWYAKADTQNGSVQVNPKRFLGSINSFLINATEQMLITLEYEPQRYFSYGSLISISTFSICIFYIAYSKTKARQVFRNLRCTRTR